MDHDKIDTMENGAESWFDNRAHNTQYQLYTPVSPYEPTWTTIKQSQWRMVLSHGLITELTTLNISCTPSVSL